VISMDNNLGQSTNKVLLVIATALFIVGLLFIYNGVIYIFSRDIRFAFSFAIAFTLFLFSYKFSKKEKIKYLPLVACVLSIVTVVAIFICIFVQGIVITKNGGNYEMWTINDTVDD